MYPIILLFVPASGIVKLGMIVTAWLFSWAVFGVGSLIAGFQGYESLKKWTPDGHLRHSKFAGLRDDKEPGEIVREG
jgi:hypothetical protein